MLEKGKRAVDSGKAFGALLNYLPHRKQRTRVNGTARLNFGTTFIQHFLADLFLIHSDIDIANFTDDNTPYLSAKNVEHVIESLERASLSLFRWFETNFLKGNADKYNFLVSTSSEVSLNVNNFKIKNSDCEKLLGVKFDSNLRFDQYITHLLEQLAEKYTH